MRHIWIYRSLLIVCILVIVTWLLVASQMSVVVAECSKETRVGIADEAPGLLWLFLVFVPLSVLSGGLSQFFG